jgi:hypothetical protein
MRKSVTALALVAFMAFGLLYTGTMTLAHAYVHVGTGASALLAMIAGKGAMAY